MFRIVRVRPSACWLIAGALFASASAWAQPNALPNVSPATPPLARQPLLRTLPQAFEAAWAMQPLAASRGARTDAAEAARRAASTWTAGPPAADAALRTDRIGSGAGAREYQFGVSAPLWLPTERERSSRLANAQLAVVDTRLAAARLRLAGVLREAWWALQRAELERALALDRLDSARRLQLDVAKRLRAGELSRADQFQAEGAVAHAEVALADANTARSTAYQALAALSGTAIESSPTQTLAAEREPDDLQPANRIDAQHPSLAEIAILGEQNQRLADLFLAQRRANPEVAITASTERGAFGERYANSLVFGVRIPLDAGPRADVRIAHARAEADEMAAQFAVERSRILAEIEASRTRLVSARERQAAAERRAALARDVRGFFEKSFQLGESDLPSRLRVEIEAVEAQRQAAVTRIAVAAAVSALRQALGLLPE